MSVVVLAQEQNEACGQNLSKFFCISVFSNFSILHYIFAWLWLYLPRKGTNLGLWSPVPKACSSNLLPIVSAVVVAAFFHHPYERSIVTFITLMHFFCATYKIMCESSSLVRAGREVPFYGEGAVAEC